MVPRMALAMTVTTDPAPPRPVTFDWDELNRLVRWVHQFAAAARGLIVVGGDKGGVGKTTVAYELAGALGAVLVDLDWTGGSATYKWGLDFERVNLARSAAGLHLMPGHAVRPYRGPSRPDLVPGHPVLENLERDDSACRAIAAGLRELARTRLVVADTHPGMNNLTRAAVRESDVVASPVPLRSGEMRALTKMLKDGLASGGPLVIVPNMIRTPLSKRKLDRLTAILEPYPNVVRDLGNPISASTVWEDRDGTSAVTLQRRAGIDTLRARLEMLRAIVDICRPLTVAA